MLVLRECYENPGDSHPARSLKRRPIISPVGVKIRNLSLTLSFLRRKHPTAEWSQESTMPGMQG